MHVSTTGTAKRRIACQMFANQTQKQADGQRKRTDLENRKDGTAHAAFVTDAPESGPEIETDDLQALQVCRKRNFVGEFINSVQI